MSRPNTAKAAPSSPHTAKNARPPTDPGASSGSQRLLAYTPPARHTTKIAIGTPTASSSPCARTDRTKDSELRRFRAGGLSRPADRARSERSPRRRICSRKLRRVMTDQALSSSPSPPARIPDPREPMPAVAVPTLGLLVAGVAVWVTSSALYLGGELVWWATILLNAVASYLLFTVAHDAGHHSAAGIVWLNNLMGRIATPFFALHAAFPVWRYIHMQHHRFTNESDGADPDRYTMGGPAWQAPFRWVTIDYAYLFFYLPRVRTRPRAERIEA